MSVPLAPTAIKILLPNVMPFNKFDVTVLPDVQLEPFAEVYVAPSAPQATKVELPKVTFLRLAVVIVVQFDPLSVDLKILTFPTAT
jgi:hypothetical protein